jgi:hypothetical protein
LGLSAGLTAKGKGRRAITQGGRGKRGRKKGTMSLKKREINYTKPTDGTDDKKLKRCDE